MDVTIDIQAEDEDTVQFVKHIEENLDPNDEYDGTVSLTTVDGTEVEELDEIAAAELSRERIADGKYRQVGLRFEFRFARSNEIPTREFDGIVASFYGEGSYAIQAHFDGGEGTYTGYVFERFD